MALTPHTAHALQSLDKVVFKPFKTEYKRACTEFIARRPSLTINKVTCLRLSNQTWDSAMREGLLKKAFEPRGIYPVKRNQRILGIRCCQEHAICCWCCSSGARWYWRGPPSIPDEAGAKAKHGKDIAQVEMVDGTTAQLNTKIDVIFYSRPATG